MTTATPTPRFARARAAALAAQHGLIEQARRVYVALTARSGVRARLHARGRDHALDKARSRAYAHESALARLTLELLALREAGASAAELERVVVHVRQVVMFAGPDPRALDLLDAHETRVDGLEDELAMRRRIRGATVDELLEEAHTRDHVAAINTELARRLRAEAHRGPTRAAVRMAGIA